MASKSWTFGIARAAVNEIDVTSTTGAHKITGTPQYMAPEQWVAGGHTDAQTDLFALGAILFEMVVGKRAFSGKTVMEIHHSGHDVAAAGAHRITHHRRRRCGDPSRVGEAARRSLLEREGDA